MSPEKSDKDGQKAQKIPPHEKALLCARLAVEKKAYGTVVLHMGPLTSIAEYFVICSGRSIRQTRAITNHLRIQLKTQHETPLGIEGEKEGGWILLDYDDVVVHVFHEPIREIYGLEKLWSDAPRVNDPALIEAEELSQAERAWQEDDDWED